MGSASVTYIRMTVREAHLYAWAQDGGASFPTEAKVRRFAIHNQKNRAHKGAICLLPNVVECINPLEPQKSKTLPRHGHPVSQMSQETYLHHGSRTLVGLLREPLQLLCTNLTATPDDAYRPTHHLSRAPRCRYAVPSLRYYAHTAYVVHDWKQRSYNPAPNVQHH